MPNYGVSLAEAIMPAADLSEQISTAGLEASGTGNMKLALNGALTIGTLDGANIEIRENVGAENIFIFGLDAQQVVERRRARFGRMGCGATFSPPGSDDPRSRFRRIFSPTTKTGSGRSWKRFLHLDQFMVAADFASYWQTQRLIDNRWSDQNGWWRTSLLNTARMSWFSSDRTIREYAEDIWRVPVDY